MKTYNEYIDEVHELAKAEIYITDKTDNVNKEIEENCVKIGVPEHLVNDIDPLTFSIFLSTVKQNAKAQLNKSELNVSLIFYAWLDEQAGQLRYNFINNNHDKIPFAVELNFVDDAWIVCKAWVDQMQNNAVLPDKKLLIYKYLITKKKTFEFEPYVGIGPLKFGMTMAEARSAVGLSYKSFQKSMDSYSPADAFDDSAMIVFYDKNDKVDAIEIYPEMDLTHNGTTILGNDLKKVEDYFDSISTDKKADDLGHDYRSLGISFAGTGDGDPDARNVGYVFIYRKGYWDEYEASLPKEWEWKPKVSVGPINFGMTRTEVRALIESPLTETNFMDDETNMADDYTELGLRICYNADSRCRLVQCSNADKIAIKYLFVNGMNQGGISGLMDLLKEQDAKIIFDATSCDSAALGLFIVNHGYTQEATRYSPMSSITFSKD